MSEPQRLPGMPGAVIWAISLSDAKTPFRHLEHDGSETQDAPSEDLAQAVLRRKITPELDLAVSAKMRPVLLLQDRPARRFRDDAAFPLARRETCGPAEQAAIRDQNEESLCSLGHNKKTYEKAQARPKRSVRDRKRPASSAPVSDLVAEQRR